MIKFLFKDLNDFINGLDKTTFFNKILLNSVQICLLLKLQPISLLAFTDIIIYRADYTHCFLLPHKPWFCGIYPNSITETSLAKASNGL